jgi:hypothetical protein
VEPQVAAAYLQSLQARFCEIQAEYRRRRRAFDALFHDRDWGPNCNIAARWAETLDRLDQTDAQELADAIRRHLQPEP